jgi:hypothetical protein
VVVARDDEGRALAVGQLAQGEPCVGAELGALAAGEAHLDPLDAGRDANPDEAERLVADAVLALPRTEGGVARATRALDAERDDVDDGASPARARRRDPEDDRAGRGLERDGGVCLRRDDTRLGLRREPLRDDGAPGVEIELRLAVANGRSSTVSRRRIRRASPSATSTAAGRGTLL